MFASGVVQFPVMGRTQIAEDFITVAVVTTAPPSSRWCGIDVKSGTILLYGPGAEHAAFSPAGLHYSAATIKLDELKEYAANLEMVVSLPKRGRATTLNSIPGTTALKRLLASGNAIAHRDGSQSLHQNVLHSAATVLAGDSRNTVRGERTFAESRRIVHVCCDYVDGVASARLGSGGAGAASISDLCMVAHVSERRLRNAFTQTFGLPPIQYFRMRSLSRVRGRLVAGRRDQVSIGDVAMDHGFPHLGRFAAYYKEVFAERPSVTLRSG
jgi:AraC-like DNA-binding protein